MDHRESNKEKNYYLKKRTLLGQDYFYNEKRQQIYYVLPDEKKRQIDSREASQESYSLRNCQHHLRLGRAERGMSKYNCISLQGWERERKLY